MVLPVLPAMYNNGPGLRGTGIRRVPDESDQGQSVQGDAVIGPGGEVVLVHSALLAIVLIVVFGVVVF